MKALQHALKGIALSVAKRERWARPDVMVSYALKTHRVRVLVSVSGRVTDAEVKSKVMHEFDRLRGNQSYKVRAAWPDIVICTMVFAGCHGKPR